MEAYESIMNSTRAPFSILPKPIDEDGNTVTTTGGAANHSSKLRCAQQSRIVFTQLRTHTFPTNNKGIAAQPASLIPVHS